MDSYKCIYHYCLNCLDRVVCHKAILTVSMNRRGIEANIVHLLTSSFAIFSIISLNYYDRSLNIFVYPLCQKSPDVRPNNLSRPFRFLESSKSQETANLSLD